jgi:hypothetical protein
MAIENKFKQAIPVGSELENIEKPELAGAMLPSMYADRFMVRVSDGMVRVEIGETPYNAPSTYHHAISMTNARAMDLANLIIELVKANLPPSNT